MNFNQTGLPDFPLGDDFVKLFLKLEDPVEMGGDDYESCAGRRRIGEGLRVVRIEREVTSDLVDCVELSMFYKGDTFEGISFEDLSAQDCVEQLSRLGSVPVRGLSGIYWIGEKMSFYAPDDTVQSICWHTASSFEKVMELVFGDT